MDYKILTEMSVEDTLGDNPKISGEALFEMQQEKLSELGYDFSDTQYMAHFFNSAFFNDFTESDYLTSLVERLAMKEGADLVQFSDGNIGYVGYYGVDENAFELVAVWVDDEHFRLCNEPKIAVKSEYLVLPWNI